MDSPDNLLGTAAAMGILVGATFVLGRLIAWALNSRMQDYVDQARRDGVLPPEDHQPKEES